MLSEIPDRLLAEWIAYYQIEPFGVEKEDFRAGIIASTIANVNRQKGQKAFTPKDFMPIKRITDWKQMRKELLSTYGYNNG
jgi:hypothetical protein